MNSEREVALPSTSASLMIFFMRASGANGLPLSMPIAASGPINSASSDVAGSFCTTSFSDSK